LRKPVEGEDYGYFLPNGNRGRRGLGDRKEQRGRKKSEGDLQSNL